MYRDALSLAHVSFQGMRHRDGRPAIEHSIRVASKLDDPVLQVIGLLHDVVEDTTIELGEIEQGFGKRVAMAVGALTRGTDELWDTYMRRVKENRDAILVKIADIEDNISRCHPNDKMWQKLPKYYEALRQLRELV